MIEAPTFGPVGFTPSIVGNGISCVYGPSLGKAAFLEISKKEGAHSAVGAMAIDAAYTKSELNLEITPMHWKIQEAIYTDKTTGEKVTGKTLVAVDFGNKPIQEVTDAGEHGTGSLSEWMETDKRTKMIIDSPEETVMFWVNPGREKKDNVMTPNRAIAWFREKDEVVGYFYELPGSKESLSGMVRKLGYTEEGEKPIENQVLIRKGIKPEMFHREAIEALSSSLSPDEHSFLEPTILRKLREEAELPDHIREERLTHYKNNYEEKLKKIEKSPEGIETSLGLIAQGLAALPQMLDKSRVSPRAEFVPRGEPYKLIRRDLTGSSETNDRTRVSQIASEVKRTDAAVPLVPIVHGVIAMVEIINNSGQKEPTAGKDEKREMAKHNEQFAKQVIEPIIPLLVALPIFFENITKTYEEVFVFDNKQPKANDKSSTFNNYRVLTKPQGILKVLDKAADGRTGIKTYGFIPSFRAEGEKSSPDITSGRFGMHRLVHSFAGFLSRPDVTSGLLRNDQRGFNTYSNAMEVNKPSDGQDISMLWQNVILPLLLSSESNEAESSPSDSLRKSGESLQNVQDEARDTKIYPQIPDAMDASKLKVLVQNALRECLRNVILPMVIGEESLSLSEKEPCIRKRSLHAGIPDGIPLVGMTKGELFKQALRPLIIFQAATENSTLQNGLTELDTAISQEDILTFIEDLSSEDNPLLQESLTKLSVFTEAYINEKTGKELKQFLVILIYQEIQTLKFKGMLSSPFFAGISEKVDKLEFISKLCVIARIPMLHRETWQSRTPACRRSRNARKQVARFLSFDYTRDRNDNPNHEVLIPAIENDIKQRNFSEYIFLILYLLSIGHLENNRQQKEVFLTEILERIEFIIEKNKFKNIYSIERLIGGEKTKIGQGAHFFPRSAVIYHWLWFSPPSRD